MNRTNLFRWIRAAGRCLAAAAGLSSLAVLAQAPPASLEAEVPPPQPGRTQVFEFPELPKTLAGDIASMRVRVPNTYDPARKYPVFVWINGGTGGRGGPRTDLVDPEKYLCTGLPLFKRAAKRKTTGVESLHVDYDDAEILWNAWSVMLGRLEKEFPNIAFGKGVAAGFSNGAHAVGVLLTKKPKEMRRWFGAFVFVEGGYMLKSRSPVRDCPVLVLAGEKSWAQKEMGFDSSPAMDARDFARRLKADLIVMSGVGHAFPAGEYAPRVKEWLGKEGF